MENKAFTAIACSNIALVKYWGKRDDKLILPYNSSLSMTLGEEISTKTSVMFSDSFKQDRVFINGKQLDLADESNKERFVVIDQLRAMTKTDSRILVASRNTFPTAAGMASSASGTVALVYASSAALGLKLTPKELSIIARQGSGSSCRSVFGGFVKWNAGSMQDGSDSYAEQVAPPEHWPDMMDIIGIVSKKEKKVSSRAGMKQTVMTSPSYAARPKFADTNMAQLTKAIAARDFESLANVAMRESNNLHALMLDTWPPILYLNEASIEIIGKIMELNQSQGKSVAAYTFDAGPNAHVITTSQYKDLVLGALKEVQGVEDIMQTRIGYGPKIVEGSLIDAGAGEPIG